MASTQRLILIENTNEATICHRRYSKLLGNYAQVENYSSMHFIQAGENGDFIEQINEWGG